MLPSTRDGISPSILRSVVKQIVLDLLRGHKSAHLTEALASGFGYASNAAYIADTKEDDACTLVPVSRMSSKAMAERLAAISNSIFEDELLLVTTALDTLSRSMPGDVVVVGPRSTLLVDQERPTTKSVPGLVPAWLIAAGALDLRTALGTSFPHAPGRGGVSAAIDLMYGPPGSGKSFFMHEALLAICSEDTGRLPMIGIVEAGSSSAGLIATLRRMLPQERREEAQHVKFSMDRLEHATNPFDTPLGCRQPTPHGRALLINIIRIIGSDFSEQAIPSWLAPLAGFCVDVLYSTFSDNPGRLVPPSTPKPYRSGVDAEVDAAIIKHKTPLYPSTTWWDIVDAMFALGDFQAAKLAQRHAVPQIDDVATVMDLPRIRDVFNDSYWNGESVVDCFKRNWLLTLKQFPALRSPTKLDVSRARVLAVDIHAGVPRGSEKSYKHTALAYLLARNLLGRDFYVNQDFLDMRENKVGLVPSLYLEHYKERVGTVRDTRRQIVYDDLDRTRGNEAVREQVLVDIREGRKWGTNVAVVSQFLDDFDKNAVDMSTAAWILGVGNDRAASEAGALFGLSGSSLPPMISSLTGPGEAGTPIMASAYSTEGHHEELVLFKPKPENRWGLTTDVADAYIRDRLFDAMDPDEALRRLLGLFPKGSAQRSIDSRLQRMLDGNGPKVDSTVVMDELILEIMGAKTSASKTEPRIWFDPVHKMVSLGKSFGWVALYSIQEAADLGIDLESTPSAWNYLENGRPLFITDELYAQEGARIGVAAPMFAEKR